MAIEAPPLPKRSGQSVACIFSLFRPKHSGLKSLILFHESIPQSVILTLNVAYGVPQTYSKNLNTG